MTTRHETRYYHRRTANGELLADIELGIVAHDAIHAEWWTGMSPFSRLNLKDNHNGLARRLRTHRYR